MVFQNHTHKYHVINLLLNSYDQMKYFIPISFKLIRLFHFLFWFLLVLLLHWMDWMDVMLDWTKWSCIITANENKYKLTNVFWKSFQFNFTYVIINSLSMLQCCHCHHCWHIVNIQWNCNENGNGFDYGHMEWILLTQNWILYIFINTKLNIIMGLIMVIWNGYY